ncbi:MAG: flagellar type III secretion system pore protein FliP [Oscillospiraceae bacterium]|jgi:flagellar biosynthetic protein FliP|nr:flagellar type III secretion system pore protein FliP [Oscillospiraceae bacterium]
MGSMENIINTLFGEGTNTVDIVILLTVLTLLPSIVLMMTSFTRIVIVLGFLRNAMGMQQAPPNQVVVGLALFLTMFVMGSTLTEIYDTAYTPYSEGEITQDEFFDRAMIPARSWMRNQTYQTDMDFFIGMSGGEFDSYEEVPDNILIPAFMTSEIKHAFQIGFFIYIPFIVIDMIVASTLMAMGMMMLPPAMISLPFKIILFVLADGWTLTISALVQSFH